MFGADERKAALDHSFELRPEYCTELGSLIANRVDQVTGSLAVDEQNTIASDFSRSDFSASVMLGVDHSHASRPDHNVIEVGVGARYDSIVEYLDSPLADELVKKATHDPLTVCAASPCLN